MKLLKNELRPTTMYIVYGGRSAKYEHFNNKYTSVQVERFVFQKPPQNHILTVTTHLKNEKKTTF